jgi:hypothetical protein
LPASTVHEFVSAFAQRIASFPAAGLITIKERVNAISLAATADFRRDSDLFGETVRNADTQRRLEAAMKRGLQTRDAELELAAMLEDLTS